MPRTRTFLGPKNSNQCLSFFHYSKAVKQHSNISLTILQALNHTDPRSLEQRSGEGDSEILLLRLSHPHSDPPPVPCVWPADRHFGFGTKQGVVTSAWYPCSSSTSPLKQNCTGSQLCRLGFLENCGIMPSSILLPIPEYPSRLAPKSTNMAHQSRASLLEVLNNSAILIKLVPSPPIAALAGLSHSQHPPWAAGR